MVRLSGAFRREWRISARARLISDFDVSKLDKTEYETNTYIVSEDFEKIKINTKETDIVLLASEDNTCKVICVEQKKLKHSVSAENGTLQISEMDTHRPVVFYQANDRHLPSAEAAENSIISA